MSVKQTTLGSPYCIIFSCGAMYIIILFVSKQTSKAAFSIFVTIVPAVKADQRDAKYGLQIHCLRHHELGRASQTTVQYSCVSQQLDYRSLINAVAFRRDRVSATGGSGGNGKIEFCTDRKYEVREERADPCRTVG